ncbi:DNRE-like protein [Mya arenaria]|uniref:DNRE-like protein n=1 Tax=Mya arenaria TaxID=6604 RepID=A0ABY7GEC1_MYAAR|nr:DNRE-like protein [Mya arenaria]
MASLKDKVVIITGAATALHMIKFQPRLVITGRVKSRLDAVEESLLAAGLKQDRFQGHASYSISKAALDQFTGILANEMGEHGVRVNSVNPGVIRTGIYLKFGMSEEEFPKFSEDQKRTHALGRVGEPDEVAKAITFLASDQASFTSGQILYVDGGHHKRPII